MNIKKEEKNIINWLNEEFNKNYSINDLPDNIKKIDWIYISRYQTLSEVFIEKYKNKVGWFEILKYQNLSESFIAKYKDKLNWKYISKYQNLSFPFIFRMKDYVNWNIINKRYNVTKNDMIKSINREELNNFTLNI